MPRARFRRRHRDCVRPGCRFRRWKRMGIEDRSLAFGIEPAFPAASRERASERRDVRDPSPFGATNLADQDVARNLSCPDPLEQEFRADGANWDSTRLCQPPVHGRSNRIARSASSSRAEPYARSAALDCERSGCPLAETPTTGGDGVERVAWFGDRHVGRFVSELCPPATVSASPPFARPGRSPRVSDRRLVRLGATIETLRAARDSVFQRYHFATLFRTESRGDGAI